MSDLPLIASTAAALVFGAIAGWWWSQRRIEGERAQWRLSLRAAVDDARLDPLTKLGNRRAFDEQLAIQTAVAQRYGAPCAIVLIDVDDLKSVNDRGGHQAGDTALRQLAESIRTSSRAADLAMRLGGDEFALLLPQTDVAGAATLAARILERLASLGLHASLGVAAHRRDEAPADLVRRADQALYHAKRAGGRQCSLHDGRIVLLQRSIDTSIR